MRTVSVLVYCYDSSAKHSPGHEKNAQEVLLAQMNEWMSYHYNNPVTQVLLAPSYR